MKKKIVERRETKLLGLAYYGTLSGEGWSEENQIGRTWQRFTQYVQQNWSLIKDKVIDEKISYEVHLWNEEEWDATGVFRVFVGVEVDSLEDMPVDLLGMVLPAGTFAMVTAEGEEITTIDMQEVLPPEDYPRVKFRDHLLEIQCYDQDRFKGLDNIDESEVDYYIPIRAM
jgi:predicted transcriptional regulator YdeE